MGAPKPLEARNRTFLGSLKVLFAAKAPKAVILRRGPRSHFHMIAWDVETDTFHRGQWMRGLVRLCDLSPDGTKLLYWAAQYHRPRPAPSSACEAIQPPPPAAVIEKSRATCASKRSRQLSFRT